MPVDILNASGWSCYPSLIKGSGAAQEAEDLAKAAACSVLDPVLPMRKLEDRSKPARQDRITKVLESLQARMLRSKFVVVAYKRWDEIEAKPDTEWTPGEEYFVECMVDYECKYGLLLGNTNSESTRSIVRVIEQLDSGVAPPSKPPPSLPPFRPVDEAVRRALKQERTRKEAEERRVAIANAIERSSRTPIAPTNAVMPRATGALKRPLARPCSGASVASLLANTSMVKRERSSDAEERATQDLFGGPETPAAKHARVA